MARGAVDDWLAGAVRTMLRRIDQLESDAKLLKTSVEVSSHMPRWKDQFVKEMKEVQSAGKMKEAEEREVLVKEISKEVQSAIKMKEAEECKVLPVKVKNVQSQLLRVESTVRDNTVDSPQDLPVVGAAQCDEQPAHDQLANHSRVAHREASPFEKRCSESKRIVAKYQGRIPVICEKSARANLPDIDKKKFLIPGTLLCGEFKQALHKRLTQLGTTAIASDQTIYLSVNRTSPKTGALMSEVYEQHRSDDGFLHIEYGAENTLERVEDAQPANHSKVADCDGHSDAQPANHPKGADRDEQSEDAQLANHSKVLGCDSHSEDAQLADQGHSKFYDCTEHGHEFPIFRRRRAEDAQPANHSKVADCAERVQDTQPANHSKVADRDEQYEHAQRASHSKVAHCSQNSEDSQLASHSKVADCAERVQDAQHANHSKVEANLQKHSKVADCAEHSEDSQLASHSKVAHYAEHCEDDQFASHSKVANCAEHSDVHEDKAVKTADVVNMNSYFDQLIPLFDQDLMKKCKVDNDVDDADICDMEAFIETLRTTPIALRRPPTVKFSTEDCAKADCDEVKAKQKMKRRNNSTLESCFGFEGEHDFENGFDGASVEEMIMDGIEADFEKEAMIDDQDSDEDRRCLAETNKDYRCVNDDMEDVMNKGTNLQQVADGKDDG